MGFIRETRHLIMLPGEAPVNSKLLNLGIAFFTVGRAEHSRSDRCQSDRANVRAAS